MGDGKEGGPHVERGVKDVGGLEYLWRNRDLSVVVKMGMLEDVVAPTVSYSPQTWVLNARERRIEEVLDVMSLMGGGRALGVSLMNRVWLV